MSCVTHFIQCSHTWPTYRESIRLVCVQHSCLWSLKLSQSAFKNIHYVIHSHHFKLIYFGQMTDWHRKPPVILHRPWPFNSYLIALFPCLLVFQTNSNSICCFELLCPSFWSGSSYTTTISSNILTSCCCLLPWLKLTKSIWLLNSSCSSLCIVALHTHPLLSILIVM